MAEQPNNAESVVPNADTPDDLKQLEALVAADEKEWQAEKDQGRDRKGRFTDGADKGQRPGQRATPEVLSGKPAGRTEPGQPKETSAPAPESGQTTADKHDDKTKTETPKKEEALTPALSRPTGEGEDEAKLTPYQKAQKRQADSWKKLNEEKEALRLEREQFEAQRRTARAQPARPAAPQQANGYTAREYLDAAGAWEAEAVELEAAGDFETADQRRETARLAREAAKSAPAQRQAAAAAANGSGNGDEQDTAVRRAWATVKADLPEALVPGSPLNKGLLEFIQKNGGVAGGPDGVYRAVIAVGRAVTGRLEREAARVPELLKAGEVKDARIQELEAQLQKATSLPEGGAFNRGEGASRNFGDLPAAERERILEADLHMAL